MLFVRQSCKQKMHMQTPLGDKEQVAGRASLFTRANVSLHPSARPFFTGLPRSAGIHLVSICNTKKMDPRSPVVLQPLVTKLWSIVFPSFTFTFLSFLATLIQQCSLHVCHALFIYLHSTSVCLWDAGWLSFCHDIFEDRVISRGLRRRRRRRKNSVGNCNNKRYFAGCMIILCPFLLPPSPSSLLQMIKFTHTWFLVLIDRDSWQQKRDRPRYICVWVELYSFWHYLSSYHTEGTGILPYMPQGTQHQGSQDLFIGITFNRSDLYPPLHVSPSPPSPASNLLLLRPRIFVKPIS